MGGYDQICDLNVLVFFFLHLYPCVSQKHN